jgi:Bifunctional DNA primase/polymerase, N-terminal
VDDPRSDELLEECGRVAWRLGLALAWSDGLEGESAKSCSRVGLAAWKSAARLPVDEDAAVAFFRTRARRRNPLVVASRSDLVLLEFDGDLTELSAKYGLWDLPGTVQVQSRRGQHLYYRPPAGRPPMKVQVDRTGVIVSEDGYVVGAGALHPSGLVYGYVSDGPIAGMPR